MVTLALAASPCTAGPAAALREGAGGIALHFVPVDSATRTTASHEASIDMGRVSALSGAHPACCVVIRQRVGLRLEGPYARARVSVSLATEAPGATVRVNGRTVSAVPQVIDPAHRLNVTVVHEIEMTIPAHVPPGPFLSNLVWQADSD